MFAVPVNEDNICLRLAFPAVPRCFCNFIEDGFVMFPKEPPNERSGQLHLNVGKLFRDVFHGTPFQTASSFSVILLRIESRKRVAERGKRRGVRSHTPIPLLLNV